MIRKWVWQIILTVLLCFLSISAANAISNGNELKSALYAGGTGSLTSDITIDSLDMEIPFQREYILNLNGHTLYLYNTSRIDIYGKLTIRGNGWIYFRRSGYGDYPQIDVKGTGALRIENGGISNTVAGGSPIRSTGTVELTGGTISSQHNAILLTGGSMTMSGGTIEGNNSGIYIMGTDGNVSLTITGGSIQNCSLCGICTATNNNQIYLSGDPSFSNNESDISARLIQIIDDLDPDVRIGVNPETVPSLVATGIADHASFENFYSQRDGCELFLDSTGDEIWIGTPVTVSFDENGGTGNMDSQVIYKGISTSLNVNSFTPRENYLFNGWNTEADGSGTAYADGANIEISSSSQISSLTLYAQWELNPIIAEGTCGTEATWSLTREGLLTVSGTGAINNYSNLDSQGAPWGRNIKGIVIEEGITRIGNSAFYSCENLTSVQLPSTLQQIGYYAFYGCKQLPGITLPEGLLSIGHDAFASCTILSNIQLPESLTSIGDDAFGNNKGIISVYIPKNVQTVGKAFLNCFKMESFTVSSENENFTAENGVLFSHNQNTLIMYPQSKKDIDYSVPYGVTAIGQQSFMGNSYVRQINLPDTITTIGTSAFAQIRNLEAMSLPSSVASLGRDVFHYCQKLQYIDVSSDNQYYSSEDGVLFDKDKKVLVCYPIAKSDEEYIIPETVETIEEEAFYFSVVKSISLPDGLKSIGDNAFSGNAILESINLPDSLLLMGTHVFSLCRSLTEICIPYGITEIKAYAFNGCTSLTSLTIPDSVTKIANNALGECPNLIIYCGCTSYASGFAVDNAINHIDVHQWNDPEYVWNDDNTTVTATHVCARNGEHTETETVMATSETIEPTCIEKGGITYTSASFENETFTIQSKSMLDIDMLGHEWGEPVYVWADDNLSLTATRICERDQNHIETETINCTVTVALEPTCTEKGKTTYSPDDFNNVAFTAPSPKTEEDIPALGHSWTEVKYEWTNNYSSVTATRICNHNAEHKETETAQAVYSVVTPAQCEENGVGLYAGNDFVNPAFLTQSKEIIIPSTGHQWNEPTYEWSDDNLSLTASRVCEHDHSHIETETVNCIATVALEPTCTEKGKTTYSPNNFIKAVFTAPSPKTEEDIPALGHFWADAEYEWSNDNSSVTATRTCNHNAKHMETETVQADYAVAVSPKCEETGKGLYSGREYSNAAFLKQTKETTIPATGHTPVTDEAIAPTYTVTGWTEGSHCSVCGKILVAQNEIPVIAVVENGECGTNMTWKLYEDGFLSITGTGYMSSSPWTKARVKRVEIGEGVKSISGEAFFQCTNLTEAVLPSTMKAIEEKAFRWCSSLSSINFPDGLVKIGNNAFDGCESLTTAPIPDTVTQLGDSAFFLSGITTVTIPANLTSIGACTFAYTYLTVVDIPNKVKSIGEGAFLYCENLEEVSIPDSIISMDKGAFSHCSALESITIPDKLETIPENAFNGCTSLNSITIPENVTVIGQNAFSGCTGLLAVDIPGNVSWIMDGAFSGCTELADITIQRGKNPYIYETTFSNCYSLQNVTIYGLASFVGTAFSDSYELESITIPECNTETISQLINNGYEDYLIITPHIESIISPIVDPTLTETGLTAEIKCLICNETLAQQESISALQDLSVLYLPENLTEIEAEAFANLACEAVIIPEGCTAIGDGAFANCKNLIYVKIPSSVRDYSPNAFTGCNEKLAISTAVVNSDSDASEKD